MAKYRKKPVVIEAVQFTGENLEEIGHFAGLNAQLAGRERRLEIKTKEGVMTANPGDYIIKGVQGEFYPIKEDIFEKTYEPVEGHKDE